MKIGPVAVELFQADVLVSTILHYSFQFEFLILRYIYTNTHISRRSDKFHFQLVFKFCIVIYFIILCGCPYIINCVVIYKL